MKYYLDTEFIEGFHAWYHPCNWFQKDRPAHTIDLISIGIVAEDGREYYAVSKDFDLKLAWNRYDEYLPDEMGDPPKRVYWLRENVLKPLHKQLAQNISGDMKNVDYFFNLSGFSYRSLKSLIAMYGKTNDQIAAEIQCFTAGMPVNQPGIESSEEYFREVKRLNAMGGIDFYGYYSDYDWVVFCSLFGRMLDLPAGFPMYCRDLKQTFDEIASGFRNSDFLTHFHQETPLTTEEKVQLLKKRPDYPEGDNEHHALADARWNRQLHKFLSKIQYELLNTTP